MKFPNGSKLIITMAAIFCLALAIAGAQTQPTASATPAAERDLLLNTDFSVIDANGNPTAWFRAMIPAKTTNLQAGVEKESGANVMFLSQGGTQGMLFNNWAQRIENPPVGAPLKIVADVATEAATGKGGVVMLMFFDAGGNITGAASSEGQVQLTESKRWTKVELETTVPTRTTTAIMRIGLAAGATGKIKARTCRVIQAAAASALAAAAGDQLIVNPEFKDGELNGNPTGWFRAMIPSKTTNLQAGLAKDDKGPYIYLSQEGTTSPLFNNWAQNLAIVPRAGVRLRLEAEVATRDATKGAAVMVMFFGADDSIRGSITSEGKVDLTGTKTWTPITVEGEVPTGAAKAIVRCGLGASGSGVLYIRSVKLHQLK